MDMAFVAATLSSVRPIDSLESQYELLELEGGAVVYAFTGFPKHYACPHCFTYMLFTLSSIGVLAQGILSVRAARLLSLSSNPQD